MAAITEQELDSLLSSFDQIYEDFKSGVSEIQFLRLSCNAATKEREALEVICNSLKQENEQLKIFYTDSLKNLVDQLEWRTECQSLKEELKKVSEEHISKEAEYLKTMELLAKDCATKVADYEAQIRGLLLDKSTHEATINQLHQDLIAHETHIQVLANRLEQVSFNEESKYLFEIQDLKDCLLVEQEEKTTLSRRLQDLEKELLLSKTRQVEQQRDFTSNQHVETLKVKIMKLRKENEILKRKLSHSEEG
ncbi:hypothetical protein HS088_TW09G00961 [Tripterygium wilfordii]|uniref:Protein At-4/1 n=1 Tax=Tripterygium wilfordii TaxID=458696 RepID=A0A7J7D9H8_TRIWF|nr:protein At-4/1 [Tripterygium wilfordii]XP_038712468.1 protein At-4/1 [Tripterygium wilfordii]KAF5742899.1 hypothetical protein HS088_TW09G00961 [Tripterygium wilfordii]